MPLPLTIAVVVGISLVYWAILKGGRIIRIIALSLALTGALGLGYLLGQTWERLRNYDQFVYRFSQYSSYLRNLAERQQIVQLTNDVVLFDHKFNPHQRASDLQDVMFQLLKVGPYYQTTNSDSR
jgi:hypothetical protein